MPRLPAGLQRRTARRLGVGFASFGIAGVVLVALLAFALESAFSQLELVDASGGPLAQASTSIGDAATAFGGFGTSLADAERASNSAATTSRNASATASRLADTMSLSVFGAQPFLPLAQGFRQQASDLDAMGRDLDALAVSLDKNQSDIAKIRADLADLHSRLQSSGVPLPLGALRLLAGLVLLWLSLPAIASLVLGSWLLRAGARAA